MVAVARDRVPSANVSFEIADVFSWRSGAQFDVIFFSAWLSHVPASEFERFWGVDSRLICGEARPLALPDDGFELV